MNSNKSLNDITINFNFDNKKTEAKAIILVSAIIITITLSIIYKSFAILLVGGILVVLLKNFMEQPDGLLKLRLKDEQLYLAKIIDKKTIFSSEVISSEFSWNYVHTEIVSGNNAADKKSGHTNHLQLKLEFQLADGKRIAVHEELLPWKSIPKDWNYKVFDEEVQDEILLVNKSLKVIKERFENKKRSK